MLARSWQGLAKEQNRDKWQLLIQIMVVIAVTITTIIIVIIFQLQMKCLPLPAVGQRLSAAQPSLWMPPSPLEMCSRATAFSATWDHSIWMPWTVSAVWRNYLHIIK